MTYALISLGASSRDDVPVGDPGACDATGLARLLSNPCVDLTDSHTIQELKRLFNEASGYATRLDTDLWTPEEEQSLWQWALDQEKVERPSGKYTVHELLRQTASRWVYPSPTGLFVLWANRKCTLDACAARYPTLWAVGTQSGAHQDGSVFFTVSIRAPVMGTPGKAPVPDVPPDVPPGPPPHHDQPPPDQPVARMSMATKLAVSAAVTAAAYGIWRLFRGRRRS